MYCDCVAPSKNVLWCVVKFTIFYCTTLVEVASFYFKRENYEKAEIKLLAILEIYENDGWECLAQKIRQDLVELYKRSQDHLKLSKILYSMITTENESIFAEFLDTLSKINKGMITKNFPPRFSPVFPAPPITTCDPIESKYFFMTHGKIRYRNIIGFMAKQSTSGFGVPTGSGNVTHGIIPKVPCNSVQSKIPSNIFIFEFKTIVPRWTRLSLMCGKHVFLALKLA